MKTFGSVAVTVGLLALALPARAQDGEEMPEAPPEAPATTAPPPLGSPTTVETVQVPAVVAPAPEPVPLLDERTAYMVGKHRLKLGILAFEFGILKWLSVGTDPPVWALRAFTRAWVPNLHAKLQFFDRDPVALAVLAGGYWAPVSEGSASGHVIVVPVSLFATLRAHPRFYVHGEGTYVNVRAVGAGNVDSVELNGAASARAGQAGLMLQYRLTRIFSLTARGRYQFYTADVPYNGSGAIDPFTTATVSGQIVPPVQHPWEAVGGIAVLWKHFHLLVGGGYGYYFLPGLDVPNTTKSFVPDVSLSVLL